MRRKAARNPGRIPHEGVLWQEIPPLPSPAPRVPHVGVLGGTLPEPAQPPFPYLGPQGLQLHEPPAPPPRPAVETPRGGPRLLPRGVEALVSARDALRFAKGKIAYLEDELQSSRKKTVRLTSALEKKIELGAQSDIVKGGLGGRTSIESYRNTVGLFMDHMNELGISAVLYGRARAELHLQTTISADFQVMFAAPPATRAEGTRRSLAEWMITDPASVWELTGEFEPNERARRRLINLVLRSGIDSSTHELVRRSPETQPSRRYVATDHPEE